MTVSSKVLVAEPTKCLKIFFRVFFSKHPYSAEVQQLDNFAKMNLEIEQDFMLDTVMTQMDVLEKSM